MSMPRNTLTRPASRRNLAQAVRRIQVDIDYVRERTRTLTQADPEDIRTAELMLELAAQRLQNFINKMGAM